MNQRIEVTVSPSGETKIETKGVPGASCQAVSRFLEQALGTKRSEELTAEFYQAQASHSQIQQGRGI